METYRAVIVYLSEQKKYQADIFTNDPQAKRIDGYSNSLISEVISAIKEAYNIPEGMIVYRGFRPTSPDGVL